MAFKALLLVALLGVAAAGPTIVSRGQTGRLKPKLGAKQCTFGPSYWCDHIRKSSQCGMTSWCIENVWQHRQLPEDTDDVCSICKEMVKEARDQLNSNETQEELKEVLEGSCNLIPIHLIAEECDTLVDDFIPELTEMLSSQMNPQVVCQTAGLCNSARVDKMLEDRSNTQKPTHPEQQPHESTDTCATCGRRVDSLVRSVADGGALRLLDALLPLCRDMGSYSDACAADLAANIGDIFSVVQTLDATEFCLLGNGCPGLYNEPPPQLRGAGPAVDCDLCIHIVKHWRDILVANTTKEEFKEILDGICAKTKAWAPKCTQLVDEYYLIIYDFLVNEMRAHTICKAIGLCSKHGQAADVPVWVTVPAGSAAAAILRDEQESQDQEQRRRPLIRLERPAAPRPLETLPLQPLTPSMQVNTVVAKKGGVRKLHKKKRLHSVKLHKSMPRAYGNDGLAYRNPLERSEPSSSASAAVSTPQQLPLSRFGLPDYSRLFVRNTELCDLCEFGLRQLRQVLEDNATEDEITEAVARMCDLLPATLTPRCHQFVTEYGDFVIELLAQEIDPEQVCPALHLCPLPSSAAAVSGLSSSEDQQQQQEGQALSSSSSSEEDRSAAEPPGCAICEYAISTLLDYLKDKKTEDEIREGLDRVCQMLPSTVSRECEELVNTFMEEIVDMIVSSMTADEICITLRLCQPTAAAAGLAYNDVVSNSIHAVPLYRTHGEAQPGLALYALSAPLAGLPVNSPVMPESIEDTTEGSSEDSSEDGETRQSPVCILCEFVMMQLKMKLSDNSTEAEIESELKRVCSYLPAAVRADCDGFVDAYGPALLDILKADLADPDQTCAQLRLCQPAQQTIRGDLSPSRQSAPPGAGRCRYCQQIVAYAELLLADGRETVTSQELCQLLPPARRDECDRLVETYGRWVFSQLKQGVVPAHVCIGIDLCPRPAGSVHLMGGVRCLWGPDYVCQDEFHARTCNALHFCAEQVWGGDSAEERLP